MRHVAIDVGDVHGPLHGVPGVHTNIPIYSISIGPTPLCRRCPWAVLRQFGSLWVAVAWTAARRFPSHYKSHRVSPPTILLIFY